MEADERLARLDPFEEAVQIRNRQLACRAGEDHAIELGESLRRKGLGKLLLHPLLPDRVGGSKRFLLHLERIFLFLPVGVTGALGTLDGLGLGRPARRHP